MKITTSQVTKMTINGVPNLDPVAVIVENHGKGAGKITITCWGEAWSHFWSHMGESSTLEAFFCGCGEHYLAGKLKSGIRDEIDDDDNEALEALLKAEIVKDRRAGDLTHEKARDLWNEAICVSYGNHADICYDILGDEWGYRMPKKPNHAYEYLCRIILTVQAAFKASELEALS